MSEEAALRLRIVTADFYSAPPVPEFDETYNHFRGSVIKQLPVIRIFGITPTGEKVCVHMHGVYPYIYIPYPSTVPEGKENSFLYEVAHSLDEALNNSFGSKVQHVLKISSVSAKAFYGYHSNEKRFLKISFYKPSSIKRGVSLLQSGAVCSQPFQPHEAHVPYILQFFIDYNLYGMNFLSLSECSARTASKTSDCQVPLLVKETTCDIEVDAVAGNILNIHSSARVLNPGLAYIREEEERRNEEDGVPKEEGSQPDSRQFSPSPSDSRFREQLAQALKDRYAMELSNQGAESSSQSRSGSQQPAPVTFDRDDVSVLKVIFGRLVEDNLPDEDSILGFTPEQENAEEPEQDLTQPYNSFAIDSDGEDESVQNDDLSETLVWPELDGLSQIEADSPPLFVDGNMDDEKTPEKTSRKIEHQNSPRYIPLEIKLHKSPRRKKSGHHPTSPEIFKKLEENASNLRNIVSPSSSKVRKDLHEAIPSSSSSVKTYNDPNIIGVSDSSEDEGSSEVRLNYKLTAKPTSNKSQTKNIKRTAKKVLFQSTSPVKMLDGIKEPVIISMENEEERTAIEDEQRLNTRSSTESISESPSLPLKASVEVSLGVSVEDSIETIKDVSAICSPGSLNQPDRDEDSNHHVQLVAETKDMDTTQYSQCAVSSFYGDTTMCLSPFDYSTILTPLMNPPTEADISANLHLYGLEKTCNESPFYGDPTDASTSKEIGFNVISLKTKFGDDIEEFKGTFNFTSWPPPPWQAKRTVILEPAIDPPSSESIQRELEKIQGSFSHMFHTRSTQTSSQASSDSSITRPLHKIKLQKQRVLELDRRKRLSGEIEHATPNNSGMFKLDFQNLQDAQINSLHKHTTLMILELHANTRGDLRPDPEYDGVEAVFYVISNDAPTSSDDSQLSPRQTGVIMVCPEDSSQRYPFSCSTICVKTEKELFLSVVELVAEHNPDIIAGYEIEMLSWGYLIERGYVLGLNLMTELSRLKTEPTERDLKSNAFSNKDYDLRIPGRVVLNVWRLMRHEVALQSYTFESVAYHVLHTRIPKFSFKTLTFWWNHFSQSYRYLVFKNYLTMVDGLEKLLDQLNLIGRTGELASLFGIQFYEVFSRGSQFRVESMMLRLAKRFGFIAVSPSVEQRAHMRAPESLPLIMEPESRFYSDPVIVLDFQSLYPSMIIAYNYCFSTCLGRVSSLMETSEFKFGCTELQVPLKELLKLQKNIHVSPAGVAFVDKSIRHGVLPQMLEEILQTRIMVKASLKRHKNNKLLSRVLDARQLGLKLIANVTYGYTSANFSGRMPCIEVGDSVVSKGRETLERAIHLIEKETDWRARVVYGDTDSMFVLCPGRSREEAFIIGQQIANKVTASNPSPVKLKLEKVYQPCILQTKKRYVGYMYESPDQEKPVFDAKGIETVRRDGCPAASKILEKSLKLLFESKNMSIVKSYVKQQMMKVLSGRLNPAELAFAKEYRGVSGYQPNAPVPALKIAKEMVRRDRRAEPRTSERVPYVVVCGPPGLPLISLVRSLPEFLSDPAYVLNADYYISKAILPPLDRCFCLLGADVFSWYSGLPKKQLLNLHAIAPNKRKATIAQYFRSVQCLACGALTPLTLCPDCQLTPSHSLSLLTQSVGKLERKYHLLQKICGSCCGRNFETACESIDCPVFFRRHQAGNDKMQSNLLYTTIAELSQF